MEQDYKEFIANVKNMAGIDLNLYKETQMKRRLTSLRNKRGYSSFSKYFTAMRNDEHLLEELLDRITINVSEFYRNPKRWEVLKTSIIPQLLERNSLTIWSAACSTGEEPYSVAIMLKEYFPSINYRIIATDIDNAVLGKAKQAVYQEQALKELPSGLVNKYFTQEHGLYYVKDELKNSITFEKHNLLADRYPANVDLIICRNVLIYFTDQAKEMIYRNFSRALTNNGVLFVGSTEQIFSPDNYDLQLLDTFFYQKKDED
ncbi:protein-glutamate O-methyltransferase CheR, partial [Virgibacillus sp. AGTR]